jgi:hypothetical protein
MGAHDSTLRQGVQKGDVVPAVIPNSVDAIVIYLGRCQLVLYRRQHRVSLVLGSMARE